MRNLILNLKRQPSSKKISFGLPEVPGVYIFYDQKSPIYIGKANNLKNRISSYYSINLSPKTAKMVSEAREISYIKVTSELDALLLEANLVHDLKPYYNSALKDDKHPLYIRISKEKYPRVLTSRKIEQSRSNIAYYGPFPSASSVRSVLKMLRRIFPYSDHKIGKRPCLYSHIGLCNPCPNYIEQIKNFKNKALKKKEYLVNLKSLKRVLDRKTNLVIKDLHLKMEQYSTREDFESAAFVRDQISRLEYISQPILPTAGFLENPNLLEDLRNEEMKDLRNLLKAHLLNLKSLHRIECFDVAHLSGKSTTASMVTFVNGEPNKNYYRHFRVRQIKGADDIASLTEVAKRRIKNLQNWGRPDLVIVDGGKSQVNAFSKNFSSHKIPVIGIAKSFETLVIPTARSFISIRLKNSPALHFVQRIRNEAHRFARRYHHKLLAKSLLQ